MVPEVGEKYLAGGPLIQRNRGIFEGSEWIVTCNTDSNISLTSFAKNFGGFGSITIAKVFFGQNFNKIKEFCPPDRASAYKTDNHFYPEVNGHDIHIKPI